MNGNCTPHRTHLVSDFHFGEGIIRMEWLACSPGMNPIKHVRDILNRRVTGRLHPHKLSKN